MSFDAQFLLTAAPAVLGALPVTLAMVAVFVSMMRSVP